MPTEFGADLGPGKMLWQDGTDIMQTFCAI